MARSLFKVNTGNIPDFIADEAPKNQKPRGENSFSNHGSFMAKYRIQRQAIHGEQSKKLGGEVSEIG